MEVGIRPAGTGQDEKGRSRLKTGLLYAVAALGAGMLATGGILGGLHPLGLAALYAMGPALALPGAAGAVAGAFLIPENILWATTGVGVYIGCLHIWRDRNDGQALAACASALAAALAGGIGALSFLARSAAQSLLAVGLGLMGQEAVPALTALFRGQDLPRTGKCALWVWGACLCAGVTGLPFPWARWAGAALACVVSLAGARGKGESAGVLFAGAAGVGLAGAVPAMAFCLPCLCAGAGAAGLFMGRGRGRGTIAFLSVAALALVTAPALSDGAAFLACAMAGGLVFNLLPGRGIMAGPPPGTEQSEGRAARELARLEGALADVGNILSRVAAIGPQKQPDESALLDEVSEACCRSCSQSTRCWVGRYGDTLHALAALCRRAETGPVTPGAMPPAFGDCVGKQALCDAVNRGAARLAARRRDDVVLAETRACVREQYTALAGALGNLGDKLRRLPRDEPALTARLNRALASRGTGEGRVFLREGRLCARVVLYDPVAGHENNALLCRLAGEACGVLFQTEKQEGRTLHLVQCPGLVAQWAVETAPAEKVSGDVGRFFTDAEGMAFLVLCDGMGVGPPAAVDGTLSARLLGRLLAAGMEPGAAARLCSVALLGRAREEAGAGVDILRVNLFTGQAALYKAGGASGLAVEGGRARALPAAGLPLGLTLGDGGEEQAFVLAPNDGVVLLSDGMAAAGEGWLAQMAQENWALSPEALCTLLLNEATRRGGAALRDDRSVAVLRLAPVEKDGEEPPRGRGTFWRKSRLPWRKSEKGTGENEKKNGGKAEENDPTQKGAAAAQAEGDGAERPSAPAGSRPRLARKGRGEGNLRTKNRPDPRAMGQGGKRAEKGDRPMYKGHGLGRLLALGKRAFLLPDAFGLPGHGP